MKNGEGDVVAGWKNKLQAAAAHVLVGGGEERQRDDRERKIDELQSGILEVRMVPLDQIFDKLRASSDEERTQNLQKKETLCQAVEALQAEVATLTDPAAFKAVGEKLKALQAEEVRANVRF